MKNRLDVIGNKSGWARSEWTAPLQLEDVLLHSGIIAPMEIIVPIRRNNTLVCAHLLQPVYQLSSS